MSLSKKPIRLLKCAVPFCTSVGANGFFKFPACSARKAEWIKCCGLTGHNVTLKDRVCYEHFENWCFVNTIHPNRRKFLRPNAKPEKNLPLKNSYDEIPELMQNKSVELDKNYHGMLHFKEEAVPKSDTRNNGGFQLLDFIITELKSHMTC